MCKKLALRKNLIAQKSHCAKIALRKICVRCGEEGGGGVAFSRKVRKEKDEIQVDLLLLGRLDSVPSSRRAGALFPILLLLIISLHNVYIPSKTD